MAVSLSANNLSRAALFSRRWFVLGMPSAIFLLLLWLPFGFSLQGLIEEWDVLRLFTESGVFLTVQPNTTLEAQWLRPLTVLPHAIAYLIDSDSFMGWHLMMIAALLAKGAAASYLAASLTRSLRWGVFFGLLVLVYPADTMQLAFRSLHINCSLALLLTGSALLVDAQEQRRALARSLCIVSGGAMLLTATLMYEVALTLTALPLLVLWCRDGFRQTWRRVRDNPLPTAGWLLAAVAFVLYAIYASSSRPASYQRDLTAGRSMGAILISAAPRLFDVGLVRGLIGGWFDAWGIATTEFQGYAYLLLCAAACAACVFLVPDKAKGQPSFADVDERPNAGMLWRMSLAGNGLLLLGYAPYLFSQSHVAISQRTFLFATPGAALVVLAAVLALRHLSRWLANAAIVVLLGLGAGAQLFQFQHYVNISLAQQKILREIVEHLDSGFPAKTLIVLDESNQLSHTWFLREHLKLALTYLYATPVSQVQICLMPGQDWQVRDDLARSGHCVEEQKAWRFVMATPLPGTGATKAAELSVPKDEAIVLRIARDGSIVDTAAAASRRTELAVAETSTARRYRNVLNPRLGIDVGMFAPSSRSSSYRWDFGRWWSLELPIRGSGWREAEWSFGYLYRDAAAWKTQEVSQLLFDLSPRDTAYVLRGQFKFFVNKKIRPSVRIKLNGQMLNHVWENDDRFYAAIPAGLLRPTANVLEFDSAVDNSYYDLSAQLSSFEVAPDSRDTPK